MSLRFFHTVDLNACRTSATSLACAKQKLQRKLKHWVIERPSPVTLHVLVPKFSLHLHLIQQTASLPNTVASCPVYTTPGRTWGFIGLEGYSTIYGVSISCSARGGEAENYSQISWPDHQFVFYASGVVFTSLAGVRWSPLTCSMLEKPVTKEVQWLHLSSYSIALRHMTHAFLDSKRK